jgi:hypothetical protein
MAAASVASESRARRTVLFEAIRSMAPTPPFRPLRSMKGYPCEYRSLRAAADCRAVLVLLGFRERYGGPDSFGVALWQFAQNRAS